MNQDTNQLYPYFEWDFDKQNEEWVIIYHESKTLSWVAFYTKSEKEFNRAWERVKKPQNKKADRLKPAA